MYFLGLFFHHIQMCEIQLSCYHGGVECMCQLKSLEDQDMYVWTTLQSIETRWDWNFSVICSLFDFYAKCG